MKTIYILTREGRDYTQDGYEYVENMIREDYNEEADVTFAVGSVYNGGEYFKKLLQEKPDSYVVVSTSQNIFVVCQKNIQSLIHDLNDEETSWETAVAMYDQTFGTNILGRD